MARLYKTTQNIGRKIKDKSGNTFVISEAHSGFVWLRNSRGMKQIGKNELKFYTEAKRR